MKIHHSYLHSGRDWYTLPHDVWYGSCGLTLVHHKVGSPLNVCAFSVELLMLMTVDQHLYGNYQKGDDWVY